MRTLPGDPVRAGVVLVRDPATITSMPAAILGAVTAPVVLIGADYPPADGAHYDPREVQRRLAGQLGAEIRWIPATAAIGAQLREHVDPRTVLEPALFASSLFANSVAVDARPRPWPARPRVGAWLGSTQRVPVRDLARMIRRISPSRRHAELVTWGPRKQFGSVVSTKSIHLDSNEVDVSGFVGQVDVLVAVAQQGRGPHLDPVVVAALAHGCIVVLDPSFRGDFGDAALYLDQVSVDDVLTSLRSAPELVAAQQERARHFVAAWLSPDAFVSTLTQGLDHARRQGAT